MTSMSMFERGGTTLVEGDGVRVRDEAGNSYLSATSGLWNVTCGWNHPRIVDAVTEQLRRFSYGTLFRYGHDVARDLAARLLEIAPGRFDRVYFSSSGSSANEAAVKVLRRYRSLVGQPERRLVVSFDAHSWHGTGIGAMALTGEELDQEEYGVDRRWNRLLPYPDPFAAERGLGPDERTCREALAELERTEGDQVAAVIVEPVLCSGGVLMPPKGFLEEVAAATERMGAHLIVDEVATGFGRTGRMFASEHTGVRPDVVTMSKGINSGYLPLAATLFPAEVFEAYESSGTYLTHGETQSGNPAACAAALATLDVMEDENLVERSAKAGARLRQHLDALLELDIVGEVRGEGLALAVELVRDQESRAPLSPMDMAMISHLCQRNGLLVHLSRRCLLLFPPLVVTDAEVDEIAARLTGALKAVRSR
ncbi:aspartate aminotransferase family protein [Nocardiopsis eucommiae]|uniref:Aspartate aminotransferase family protein n=2 Tax=Nocardiopsidaceae TaxID=83676 RepID=A0A975LDP1_9ACTN|nr:aspartate aminotransferase family protein [Nocardiopsis eucommiae]